MRTTIGTIRRECLDWVIPLTEDHLRCILRECVAHYNRGRPASLGPGIGIRMALGASASDVLQLALGEGWRLAGIGLIAGMTAAWLSTGLMRSLVFQVSTTDPLTFAATGALLGFVALSASYLPARRATRIDPTMALRSE